MRAHCGRVFPISNGIDALYQMQATTEPMVVLLDMWMPHMNGEETLEAVLDEGALWARLSDLKWHRCALPDAGHDRADGRAARHVDAAHERRRDAGGRAR